MKSTSWACIAALCGLFFIAHSAPATAANIGWVTFHDAGPSSAAATAGFLQAPDIGYTNALTAAGHTVTRFRSHDTPTAADLATLNAFDLVIVGRSIASGHYQQADETLFWNTSLTKPVMHMGAYALRGAGANRLGLYSGSTIPDTAGPVWLTVTNPSHPIFAGVSLDGSNTMTNFYANQVAAPFIPNNLQRGISVVTGPLAAGGQVLATIANPTDLAFGGAVIALFPPGTTTASATPNVLAAPRLIFLSGSRENDGLTSEGAGIYDLQPDGQRMFLNAVRFMAVPEPSTACMMLLAVAGLAVLRKRIKR
jgi:hypothetical protein